MNNKQRINVGIGFATGRKNFQMVLRTYISNFKESGVLDEHNIKLNLFVAYDLSYNNTKAIDYTSIPPDILKDVKNTTFIWKGKIKEESGKLVNQGVLNEEEIESVFGKGYAGQRLSLIHI